MDAALLLSVYKKKEREENRMEKMKMMVIAAFSALMAWMGVLAVPVLLLVICNLIDYVTGLSAAKYRTEKINSYKGIRGITKKVCMWLLIVVGAVVDVMINYALENIGAGFELPFIVAVVVAVWLIVNEIISILENVMDIGVTIPPFLLPLVKNIKRQIEDTAAPAAEEPEAENGEAGGQEDTDD